jgi:glycogen debranching enzyme
MLRGSVAGANTRRYHALLLVARRPPVDRVVLVNHLEESVEVGGQSFPLSTNLYSGAVHPDGYRYCDGFSSLPWPELALRRPWKSAWSVNCCVRMVATWSSCGGGC